MKYDFSGRVATINQRCTDGTVFRPGAFDRNNGKIVPLVWMHNHEDPASVLGKVLLKTDRNGNLDAYAAFNDTDNGQAVKKQVAHGDIDQLSVWANHLNRNGFDLYNGDVKEVSLVYSGADPTAHIESTTIMHSDMDVDGNEIESAEIYSGDLIDATAGFIDEVEHSDDGKGESKMANTANKKSAKAVQDIYNDFDDEQKKAVDALVAHAYQLGKEDAEAEDDEDDDDEAYDDEDDDEAEHYEDDNEGDEVMHYNAFDNGTGSDRDYISHSEQSSIIDAAKQPGMTLQSALRDYAEEQGVAHADSAEAVSGFDDKNKVFDGRTSLNLMFPDYKEVYPGAPELITSDQGWITTVLAKVKKSPISRVRTSQVDIRNIDALRAQGYQKGGRKKPIGNFSLIRRTTDPQTVYVKTALNRDDIIDITDFDYVQYMYNIAKLELNEETATAIMLGDSRDDGAEGKIMPEHIRPIWTDDELYVKHVSVDVAAARKELQGSDTNVHFGESYIYAEAIVEALLHARETNFHGTGTPDFYCTPALMNKMLLARDYNGRRIYQTKTELQAALNIGSMITAEQFEGRVRTDSNGKKHKLLGIVGNLADYQVGSTKGGEITQFNQFDIDFNQQKTLIETRLSGAVTRIYSFIVLEEDVADASAGTGTVSEG